MGTVLVYNATSGKWEPAITPLQRERARVHNEFMHLYYRSLQAIGTQE